MNSISQNDHNELPRFDLPVENELLKLKLKAEFGAECSTGKHDIPDLVIHQFLKSVYEFEQKFRQQRGTVRIYEKVGQPYFRKAGLLNDEQVALELKRMLRSMEQHGLHLDVLGDYSDRIIYRFITEEFFYLEMDDIDMPGFIHHFCYEDFHPNHELDIRHRVIEFLSHWFSKKFDEYSWQLAEIFIVPDSTTISRDTVLNRVENIQLCYQSYSNCEYLLNQLEFEWNKMTSSGRATVTGKVRFDGVLENGEQIHVEGEIEFHLSNTTGWWNIYYFRFPGFDWS